MLWYIKYNDGVDEEEVLIGDLRDCQKLYLKYEGDDMVGNSKLPAKERPQKRNTPLSTTKKSNTKQPLPLKKKKPPPLTKKTATNKKMQTPTKIKKRRATIRNHSHDPS